MELRWLEDFIALARTQHFSRAAEEQNVTQPTFSRRIKLLEEEMGTTLINRQTLPLIAYHPRGLIDLALRSHLEALTGTPRFRVLHESIRSGNIRELVGLGYGLGWLPERTAHDDLAAGRLVRAGDARWEVPLEFRLFRRRDTGQPALEAFWNALAEPSAARRPAPIPSPESP